METDKAEGGGIFRRARLATSARLQRMNRVKSANLQSGTYYFW